MIHRRDFIFAIVLGLAAGSRAARAQRTPRDCTIAFLSISSHERVAHLLEALEDGLRDFGYVEKRNLTFWRRFADGEPERLPALAAELVQLNADIIVAYGATSARAAKNATSSIPIVMMVHPDPVSGGLVASMAKPGGNVTGLARLSQELSAKRLELLKETVPSISRIAVLRYAVGRDGDISVQETERAARQLGVQLQILGVHASGDLEAAFAEMKREHCDGLLTVPSTMLFDNNPAIAALALKQRLPAIYPDSEFAEAGGLASFGARLSEEFRHAATYVNKILNGAKPADLPVEQPRKIELVLNLKTAKVIGLTIPQSILLRADEVIR